MQAADTVPLRGMAAEVILRRGDAGGAHIGEALMVARYDGVGRIELFNEPAHQLRLGAALGTAEERPGSLAEPFDEARLGQQLEMPGDSRLRLAQNLGQLRNRQFSLGQQHQDAQAGFLAGRLEQRCQVVVRNT